MNNNFKMKTTRIAFCSLALLFLSSTSQAAISCNGTTSCTGLARELITGMFPVDFEGAKRLIINSPAIGSHLACDTNSWGNSVMEDSVVFDANYSLLLAAYSANDKILLRIDPAITDLCTVIHTRLIQ